MRKSAWLLALGLVACQSSGKKDESPPPPPSPAQTTTAAIPMVPVAGARAAEAPLAKAGDSARTTDVKRILKAFADEQNAWMEPYRALKTSEERAAYAAEKPRPSPDPTAKLLWPIVDAESKDDASFTALEWLVRNDRTGTDRAAELLVANFLKDERLASVVPALARGEKAVELLGRVAAESPHRAVQGAATYEQASALKDEKEYDEAKVVALLESVLKDYADVPRGKKTLGDYAKGDLREIQVFAVGKVAPDIVGEDIGGTPFKLSDYRGKVVMVDFWGDW
ncbi:MAG: hypothetical protein NTY35_01730 [Planctomycetota bacterium]|nr:hypothetical protein [Planctomycetota bacterium]